MTIGTFQGRIFPDLQPFIDPPGTVAPVEKTVKDLSVLSGNSCADALKTNSIVNDSVVE